MTTLTNFYTSQIGTSATDLTTTSETEKKYIGQLTMTNTSASAVLVYVYKILTASTETAGSGGNWLVRRTVQPGQTWNVIKETGPIVMGNSQTLSATAATGSVIWAECGGTVEN